MEWEKFQNKFDKSWWLVMKPFFESAECDEIYRVLKEKSKEEGKVISPSPINLYRPFRETKLTDLKLVIIGGVTILGMHNDLPVADGFPYGGSLTSTLYPELDAFYRGIEKELYNGLSLSYYPNPDVSYLANQGVLMLNLAMTCDEEEAHLSLWKPFMKYLISEVVNKDSINTLLIGDVACKAEKLIWPQLVLLTGNLSRDWDPKGVIIEINKRIKNSNNYKIEWLDESVPF